MTLFRRSDRQTVPSLQRSIGHPTLQAATDGGDETGRESAGPAASEGTAPERLRIGIVEDEAIIAFELEDLLSALGAEVVGTALSADEAVRLAETERPTCLTMDIRLQGQRDGISAAIEIYERFGIRSIFISAYGDRETIARGERARPLGWLSKPLRPHSLEAVLNELRKSPDRP